MASINQETNSIDQIVQTYKDKKLAPEEKKIISDFDAAWLEMQRGYKEIMKLADDGKNDEVTRLLADGSYLIKARKNTMAAVNNLHDYSSNKKEADVNEIVKSRGGWSGLLWLFSGSAAIFLIAIVIMLTKSITKPLKKISVMMQEIEKGHLSNRLNILRKDEIGSLSRCHG